MRILQTRPKSLFLWLTCGSLVIIALCCGYNTLMNSGGLLDGNFLTISEMLRLDWSHRTPSHIKNRFHVIVTFRLINSTKNKRAPMRMMEYMESLNSSLNNSHVKQVHLMHDSPEMPAYIKNHLGAQPKLILHQVKDPDVVLTLHQFAFTNLQNQVVVITQADIVLGEGFETINGSLLEEHRVMYSLSRHVSSNCQKGIDRCEHYVGSHDTFVFVPKGEITPEGKELLNHYVFSWGTERVIMRVYGKHLNYTVLNPCWIFRVYHNHCSQFRKYEHKQPKLDRVIRDMSRPTYRTW